ncbi:MAG: hypothetical protein SF097_18995 [Acidobacteriota bacterium]|nr:hypothetical protein [Acidobacteriota bacterium]
MKSPISLSKTVSLFLSFALFITTTLAASATVRADVDSWFKAWTTVGSAGTIDEASVGKLVMQGSTISFPEILPPERGIISADSSAFAFQIPQETVSGVVRYNVVATDGLFENGDFLGMRSRFRDDGNNAQVILRLFEINITTGATSLVLTLDSNDFPARSNYQTQSVSTFVGNRINFLESAYFIEATLVQKRSPLTPFGSGNPGLAVIQLQKFTPIL